MFRRLFRLVTGVAFGRALSQRSSKWLFVALGIVLLRFIDRRAAKAGKASKQKSA